MPRKPEIASLPESDLKTLPEVGISLHRPVLYLHGLQERFELPILEGAAYSAAYFAFLRKLVYLRALSIPEKLLCEIWNLEKKLLMLLHVDTVGSPTWFLDACDQTRHSERRLLLSDYDLGVELPGGTLQLGLNFDATPLELFANQEMGEDALRILRQYLKLYSRIQADVSNEVPFVRAAAKWASRVTRE